jgi:ribosomal protein S12 methylthiotransferase
MAWTVTAIPELINDFGPHGELVAGTFYRAEITEAHEYDVVARILE